MPPVPPVPPSRHRGIWRAGDKSFNFEFHTGDSGAELPRFTEKGKNVATVDVLHRIAQTAGWSMTLVGSPKERIDIDVQDADPREALRQVLKKSGAMGVLKSDRLVVVASPESESAGMLVEQVERKHRIHTGRGLGTGQSGSQPAKRRAHDDVVRFFSDAEIGQGTLVRGDVVCIGCSIELQSGSVVQGDTVAVGGSVVVNEGALVLGQAVSVMGEVQVWRGGQVMGDHVQVGLGKFFAGRSRRTRLMSLGPFGLFPTIALFAVMYLVGLLALRLWPERMRNVSSAMFENPVRSFTVGFLCWLLIVPLVVLLAISLVGIPLIPLLPVLIFLSIVLGLSSLALRIGEALPAGPGQRFVPPAALGMGMMVLLLLAFVPWLGISLLALLQFFALGASVGSRFGRALPPHQT
ncbi:MAG: hypothetical protein E6J78_14980 [Deltaproteobacteria bacterium]|nr:MAG: hypothetical protein E6J78_14980 [Deltaproteobacteria bacterium]